MYPFLSCFWLSMFLKFIYIVLGICCSFILMLCSIPFYEYTILSLYFLLLINIWVISNFGLSYIQEYTNLPRCCNSHDRSGTAQEPPLVELATGRGMIRPMALPSQEAAWLGVVSRHAIPPGLGAAPSRSSHLQGHVQAPSIPVLCWGGVAPGRSGHQQMPAQHCLCASPSSADVKVPAWSLARDMTLPTCVPDK